MEPNTNTIPEIPGENVAYITVEDARVLVAGGIFGLSPEHAHFCRGNNIHEMIASGVQFIKDHDRYCMLNFHEHSPLIADFRRRFNVNRPSPIGNPENTAIDTSSAKGKFMRAFEEAYDAMRKGFSDADGWTTLDLDE